MPSSSAVRSQIANLEKKKAGLEADRARHVKLANTALKTATKMVQANRTSSAALRQSFSKSAMTHNEKYADEMKKVAALSAKIADVDAQLASKLKSLESSENAERRKFEAARRSDNTKSDARMRKEKAHALQMSRLARTEVRHVLIEQPKPEKLRVLYFTSTPDLGRPLRVDAEVSAVQRAVEAAKYRHSIDLVYLPAPTPRDFVDRINSKRPHVVHFSGHGDSEGLHFDNGSMEDPAPEPMTFDVMARFLSATTSPPKLLIMNSCRSLEGADLLLEAVPMLIGVADSLDDVAGAIFATQFYSAIANGLSVGHAFEQGRTAIRHALMIDDDAHLPNLSCRNDIDANAVSLIIDGSRA